MFNIINLIADRGEQSAERLPWRRVLAALMVAGFVHLAFAEEGCLACHAAMTADAADPHGFEHSPCTACHGGDGAADNEADAHAGMLRRPGEPGGGERACAACHPLQHHWLQTSPMLTNENLVATTRHILGNIGKDGVQDIHSLGDTPADSLLRKLCASCHLDQPLIGAGDDPVDDRGGGCLACHLNAAQGNGHARVDARIGDEKCFGCHARSGRIALSYAGLAEVIPSEIKAAHSRVARLGDGRWVSLQEADVHHRAGMGCVDCHTGPGLMGGVKGSQGGGVDIACDDCHANSHARIGLDQWPASSAAVLKRLPFATASDQRFLTTGQGTPLWHIEVRSAQPPLLHLKSGAGALSIPQITRDHYPLADAHAALTCDACHATRAPQCFGCHVSYEADEMQWDHLAQKETPGAWQEERWDIRNTLPALGRRDDGRVDVFIPGMILTLEHPDLQDRLFVRRFARLSPHTSGQARDCESCHRRPQALGLGEGLLSTTGGTLSFSPASPRLQDGLPADAWTRLDAVGEGHAPDHAFHPDVIRRLLSAPIDLP